MKLLYFAYVGICSLNDGFEFNMPNQLVATATSAPTQVRRHTFAASPTWLDDVYLKPSYLDPFKRPRFTESGPSTRPLIPTTIIINPPPSTAFPDFALGCYNHKYLSKHARRCPTIFPDAVAPPACSRTSIPSLPIRYPFSWPLPACPSHLCSADLVRTRKYQKQDGNNTSPVPTTHFYPGWTPDFSHSHQNCKKFRPHNQLLLDHKSTLPPI
jgi:hypothetical protein